MLAKLYISTSHHTTIVSIINNTINGRLTKDFIRCDLFFVLYASTCFPYRLASFKKRFKPDLQMCLL